MRRHAQLIIVRLVKTCLLAARALLLRSALLCDCNVGLFSSICFVCAVRSDGARRNRSEKLSPSNADLVVAVVVAATPPKDYFRPSSSFVRWWMRTNSKLKPMSESFKLEQSNRYFHSVSKCEALGYAEKL